MPAAARPADAAGARVGVRERRWWWRVCSFGPGGAGVGLTVPGMGDDGGFLVASAGLTEAGSSVAAAAERVRRLDLRTPLTRAVAALAGSATAAAVGELVAEWSAVAGGVAYGLDVHAAALAAAADRYGSTDAAVASALPVGAGGEGR